MASPEEYGEFFEAIARTREMAAERTASAKELMEAAERALKLIVSTLPGQLSAEQQAKRTEGLETLLAAMRKEVAGLALLAEHAAKVLPHIDPGDSEYVGMAEAVAASLEQIAASVRMVASTMRLIHEAQRRGAMGDA